MDKANTVEHKTNTHNKIEDIALKRNYMYKYQTDEHKNGGAKPTNSEHSVITVLVYVYKQCGN
jgi:hypothetical protein